MDYFDRFLDNVGRLFAGARHGDGPKPKAQPEDPKHDPKDPPVVLERRHPDGRVERVTVRMSEAVKLISPRGWY